MSGRRDKKNPEAEMRWKEFWREHENYDSAWVRGMLHSLMEFLPFVFGQEAVARGATILYKKSGIKFQSDTDWTSADEDLSTSELSELPIFRLALALRAYAYYGLKMQPAEPSDQDFKAFIEQVEIGHLPLEWPWARDEEMTQTITAALARRKLDFPAEKGGVTPEELAALARVGRKSIINMLTPSRRDVLQTDSDGHITVESARRWLYGRSDFRPTIDDEKDYSQLQDSSEEASTIGDPVFVPSATDGSWFSPGEYATPKGPGEQPYYQVADGSHEEKYEDYWAALDFLNRSASPHWRWRDAIGRWRMKTGAGDWRRTPRQEIERLLRERDEKVAQIIRGQEKKS